MINERIQKYINDYAFCSEYLFKDWESFLDLLYAEGGRISSILWWDYCTKKQLKESVGSGGYKDPDNDDFVYAETQLYKEGLETYTLDEIKEYIYQERKAGFQYGNRYKSHELVPSFYLAGMIKSSLSGNHMEISLLSDRYLVRRMSEDDIAEIYALCKNNTLYYRYCPPFVTQGSIESDMRALPPDKGYSDKYYLGYYDGERLIAVMDLILSYPDKDTAYIGFFMTDTSVQNAGVGSEIIDALCPCLKNHGFSRVRLGWVKGNPQDEHFWKKNLFIETGTTYDTDDYTVVTAQRVL